MREMENPKCKHDHEDCFAKGYGNCRILTETDFGKDCPFYKNKRQYDKEVEEHLKIDNTNY